MRDGILVVTASNEPSVSDVLRYLTGNRVVRLNTDSLLEYTAITHVSNGETSFSLTCGAWTVSTHDIRSVWYRRPPIASVPSEKLTETHRKFAESEVQRFLWAFWNSIPTEDVVWVNHPSVLRRVENNKPYQLQVAHGVGLTVPETLITNCPKAAGEFFDRLGDKVVVKTFGSHSTNDTGWPIGVFTTPVSREHLEKFGHELKYAPVIFQNYIPKKFELRITVVGNKIFSCAIYSQDSSRTKDDWRRYDFEHVKHESYQLPAEVENKLRQCVRAWGLQYGAIDMIVTPESDYVFLEVNPSGQWGWIEALTDLPISRAIAKLLVDPEKYALR